MAFYFHVIFGETVNVSFFIFAFKQDGPGCAFGFHKKPCVFHGKSAQHLASLVSHISAPHYHLNRLGVVAFRISEYVQVRNIHLIQKVVSVKEMLVCFAGNPTITSTPMQA
jgi:hypothetical protein